MHQEKFPAKAGSVLKGLNQSVGQIFATIRCQVGQYRPGSTLYPECVNMALYTTPGFPSHPHVIITERPLVVPAVPPTTSNLSGFYSQ